MTDKTQALLPVTIPRELFDFLMGSGDIEGLHFGDLSDKFPGRFWWRSLMRDAEASQSRSLPGDALAGLEWSEDGYSLRTPFDGDVDGDGRHVVVGGETVVTFADSEVGDEYRERILAALTPSPCPGDGMRAALERIRARASEWTPPEGLEAGIAWIEAELDDEPNRLPYGNGDVPPCRNGYEVSELLAEHAGLIARAALTPSALSGDAGEGE